MTEKMFYPFPIVVRKTALRMGGNINGHKEWGLCQTTWAQTVVPPSLFN